jgi:hypothetical protein
VMSDAWVSPTRSGQSIDRSDGYQALHRSRHRRQYATLVQKRLQGISGLAALPTVHTFGFCFCLLSGKMSGEFKKVFMETSPPIIIFYKASLNGEFHLAIFKM